MATPPVHGQEDAAKQHIKIGTRLPEGKFQIFQEGSESPTDIESSKVFSGKKAVIFGVPGAFTSVCSEKHLPEYNMKADELRAGGVDVIACLSVNDAYVMREWAKAAGVDPKKVMMLADGEAAYVRSIGLSQKMPGMGDRAVRFSAFVDDMVVKHINIEEQGGSSYKVSGPDHMLGDLKGMPKA